MLDCRNTAHAHHRSPTTNINASIVDLRVAGIIDAHPDWFPWGDENKRKSAAFVLLCMSTALDEDLEDCIELLTEGSNDAGVDGLHMSDIDDREFHITVFQGKYRVNDLAGNANFPANSVQKAVDTVRVLFDPHRRVILNEKLEPIIEEIRFSHPRRIYAYRSGGAMQQRRKVAAERRRLGRAGRTGLRHASSVRPLQPRRHRPKPAARRQDRRHARLERPGHRGRHELLARDGRACRGSADRPSL